MLGPAAGMGGQGLGALFRRAMLTGALPNIGAQLAQEGNEGELNPLSVLMASASAGLSGAGAGEALRGANNSRWLQFILTLQEEVCQVCSRWYLQLIMMLQDFQQRQS